MIIYGPYLDAYEKIAELGNRAIIITDDHLEERYAEPLQEKLGAHLFSITPGENSKTRAMKEQIEDYMLERRFSRDSVVIGIGGGVVLDLAGFVAATYCRGVPFVSIPTSLLAMVDAAIGGKCGVNTPYGKNLIGAFNPATLYLYDLSFIKSLPPEEKLSGIAEACKYAIIEDVELFTLLRNKSDDFEEIIKRSVRCKQRIVQEDPRERGLRRILNFGHTIGHAIEHVMDYKITHGEAVAVGIWAEARLSHALDILESNDLEKISALLDTYGFAKHVDADPELLLRAMQMDKKGKKNTPRFSLLKTIGQVRPSGGAYCEEVQEELIEQIISEVTLAPLPRL